MSQLNALGEFGLIHYFSKQIQDLPQAVLGIGDDCAAIPKDEDSYWLLSTDSLVQGTHFLFDAIAPEDLGHKCCAVNLSDIAAMGGQPRFCLLSLSLPPSLETSWLKDFFSGFHQLANKHGLYLIGGDTTRSEHGVVIGVTVIGEVPRKHVKLRSAAQENDLLCVTSPLGASAGGLHCILNKLQFPELITAHQRPLAQVAEGQWLGKQASVHAMMDLSDGLHSDLQRLGEASACEFAVNLEQLPIAKSLSKNAAELGLDPLTSALFGGEDYALLCTVEKNAYSSVADAFQAQFGRTLWAIGRCESKGKGAWLQEGKPITLKDMGFQHF